MHFISKGLLSKEQGKAFSRLFEIRHSGDYDDFVIEHRGEAWRVLVGAKVVLFIESIKLFDGKLFFERRFCCFSISYERAVHNRFPLCTRTRQQISPNKLGRCHRCHRHRC